MRSVKALKVSIILFFLFAVPVVLAYSAGPPAGHTGAPGENTCRECHTSFSLNLSPGTFSIEGVPDVYEIGREYTITVRINHPSRNRWGFQIGAFTDAMDNGGTLSVTESTYTRKTTSNGRSYIAHVNAGTFINQTGGATWTMKWTAPSSDVGVVSFYAAGNAANNSGTSLGDNIYTAFVESRPPEVVGVFSNVTSTQGLDAASGGNAFAWSDYDADGDFDVFIARAGRGLLYRNDAGHFSEVGAALGLSTATDAASAAWGDHDNDGRPDLALATTAGIRLFNNQGSSFEDGTSASGLPTTSTKAVAWSDYDRDGDLDLFAVGTAATTGWRNSGSGTFTPIVGTGLDAIGAAEAMAWADSNADGRLDVFVATASRGVLLLGNGEGSLAPVASSAIESAAGTAAAWADYDGDGDLDLFVVGQSSRALRNDAEGFSDVTSEVGLSGVTGRSLAAGDADGDGRMDLLVVGAQTDRLVEFDGATFADVSNKAGLGYRCRYQ